MRGDGNARPHGPRDELRDAWRVAIAGRSWSAWLPDPELVGCTAHNFAKHLKALRWKTPFEAIASAWTADPSRFKIDPRHLIPGPHT